MIRIDAAYLDFVTQGYNFIRAELGDCDVYAEYRTEAIARYVYNRISEAQKGKRPFKWNAHDIYIRF